MSHPDQDRERDEPVTVTDKRRVDPQTGEVRDPGPASNGPAPGAFPGETAEEADKAAELLGMEVRHVPIDVKTMQPDMNKFKAAIDKNTCMVRSEPKTITFGLRSICFDIFNS